MSTQFNTGESPLDYWADIAAGPANNPLRNNSWANAPAAYAARNKGLYSALSNPPDVDGDGDGAALPSVALNAAATVPAIFDFSPQRYVL